MLTLVVLVQLSIWLYICSASSIPANLAKYKKHCEYRWKHIYEAYCNGRVHVRLEDDNGRGEQHQIVELVGFPNPASTFCAHFPGSPLEAKMNTQPIRDHLGCLLNRYGTDNIRFSVLEGWATEAFHHELLNLGLVPDVRRPIMILSFSDFIKINHGHDISTAGYVPERVKTMDKAKQYISLRPAPLQFMMEAMSEVAFTDPTVQHWCLNHKVSGQCVSTAQISFYDAGTAGYLDQVATLEQWRGQGLATALVLHVLREAFNQFTQLSQIYLDSTPMAVSIYEKIGFKTIGWINEYKPTYK